MQYVRQCRHFSFPICSRTSRRRYLRSIRTYTIILPLKYLLNRILLRFRYIDSTAIITIQSIVSTRLGKKLQYFLAMHPDHPARTLWNDRTFQGDNFQLISESADGESLFREKVPFVKSNISAARKVPELDDFMVHYWIVEKSVHTSNLKTLAGKVRLVEMGIVKCLDLFKSGRSANLRINVKIKNWLLKQRVGISK